MDADPLPDATEAFATRIGPPQDDVIAEMDARADREGFPTVGPALGGWLRLLARAVEAERAFEFGSGFGYSAYWIAPAIPADGEIVLTEIDEAELDDARENLERGGYADRARFEHGDAIDIVGEESGPFEYVLIDNEKDRYVEAFEAVREMVPVGGVVVADNAMEGPGEFDTIRSLVAGEPADASDAERGIAEYLEHVHTDPAFESTLLPLGEGLSVSLRTA